MGVGSIPYRAILAYADWNGFYQNETDTFIREIMEIDRFFVAEMNKKASKPSK